MGEYSPIRRARDLVELQAEILNLGLEMLARGISELLTNWMTGWHQRRPGQLGMGFAAVPSVINLPHLHSGADHHPLRHPGRGPTGPVYLRIEPQAVFRSRAARLRWHRRSPRRARSQGQHLQEAPAGGFTEPSRPASIDGNQELGAAS